MFYGGFLLFLHRYFLSKKVFFLIMVNFTVALMFLTGSRNVLICTILVTLFCLFKNKKHYLMIFLTFSVMAGCLIFTFYPDEIDQISSFRISLWNSSLKHNLDEVSTIFGIGLDKPVRPPVKNVAPSDDNKEEKFHVDNYYIEILIEYGFFGIFLFLVFLFFVTIKIQNYGKNKLKYFRIGLFLSLLYYGFFDAAFLSIGNFSSFIGWLLLLSGNNEVYFLKKQVS